MDRAFHRKADAVVVLQLPGWDTSKGVLAEIEIAREMVKPIEFCAAGQGRGGGGVTFVRARLFCGRVTRAH